MTCDPTFDEERSLRQQGYVLIAGVDEAGRGSLAGPVVAAAVVLPASFDHPLPGSGDQSPLTGLRDSKQLSPIAREGLYGRIIQTAEAVGLGVVDHTTVDLFGIGAASRIAMRLALRRLKLQPDFVLIDGFAVPGIGIPQKHLIKGDCHCLSIAAASVIAKVARDRLMCLLDRRYPAYRFAENKGYGTSAHLEALAREGPCPLHRRSFNPLREALASVEPDWLSWN
jgi:ribonuclease HII